MEEIEKNIVHDIATIINKNLNSRMIWIPEIYGKYDHCGKALLGLLKQITIKALKQVYEFDHVIEITAQPPKAPGSRYSHAREQRMIAHSLGILVEENGRLQKLLESQDELDYYQYSDDGVEERGLIPELSKKIYDKLRGNNYLFVLEHLEQPIDESIFTELGLPLPDKWNQIIRLVTTPSNDILEGNKSNNDLVLDFERPRLRRSNPIETLLLLEASDIISSLSLINCQDYIAATKAVRECLIYCLLFSNELNTPHGCGIQEGHLIKCWIEEGFITKLTNIKHGKIINGEERQQQQNVKEEDRASIFFDTGKNLLDKFVSRSLLRRHPPRHDQNAIHPQIEATNIIRFAFSELQSKSFEMAIYSKQQDDLFRLNEWENKNQISFIGSNRETVQNFLLRKYPKLTTLILRGCSALKDIPDDFFKLNVPCLKVLDLSYTDLTYLPSSVFCLRDLMLLSLRGCSQLITITSSPSSSDSSLPSPVHALHSLQVLDLSYLNMESLALSLDMPNLTDLLLVGCVSLKDPPSFLESLTNLQVFCLTGSLITTFQESTFSRMESLRVVDLSDNYQLVSLPGSLSKAKRLLEELRINNCKALKEIKAIGGAKIRILSLTNIDCLTSLIESFPEMDSLEELYIKGCRVLKEIKMAGNTKIRSFFLSGSPIVQLSLRGCKNLETVNLNDLEELEVLDLSLTRINEFPVEIFDLPKLRRFDMLCVPQLRRFPWYTMRHLPKEFNLDHCSCDCHNNGTLESQDQTQQLNKDKVRAHIFVDDPRFFCSLNKEACVRLLQNEEFFSQFHVTISPCDDPECNKTGSSKKEAAPGGYCRSTQNGNRNGNGNFPYRDIYSKATYVKHMEEEHRPNRHLCRHLTVRGVDRFPPGHFWLFNYIDSLSMTDVGSPVSLTSTDESEMEFLKECRLDKCHDMKYVVVANRNDQMSQLEILWVSGLGKLCCSR